jgi:peptide chain release factor 1
MALALLTCRLASKQQSEVSQEIVRNRRDQIGSGERSDKIRTVQMQNGQVVNHLNGRKLSVERYLKGDLAAIQ